MRTKKKPLDCAEWDFSPLEAAPKKVLYFACLWEYHRETLRLMGSDDIPPPWLTFKSHELPFFRGMEHPLREVDESYHPRILETVIRVCIDGRFEHKDILRAFETWIKGAKKSMGGRRDVRISRLWKLSVYRLRQVEGLTLSQAQSRLRKTHLWVRGKKFFREGAHQAFSDATRATSKEVAILTGEFRKYPLSSEWIRSEWRAVQAQRRTNK